MPDSTFEERTAQGAPHEDLSISILIANGWTVERTGVEHQPQNHPSTPDLRISRNGQTAWIETKGTDAIAQWCYEHCLLLAEHEHVFVMVSLPGCSDAQTVIPVAQLQFHADWPIWRNYTSSPSGGSGQPWKKFLRTNGKVLTFPS